MSGDENKFKKYRFPENLRQERLQQMERDMVCDLQKEKTLGGLMQEDKL